MGSEGEVLKIRGGAPSWEPDSTYADNWRIQTVRTGDGLLGVGVEGNELSIGDYMIEPIKIDPTDADPGQILKYDGGTGQVIWADDETGGGGSTADDDWNISGESVWTNSYVGIGTDTPDEQLHIYNAAEARLLIESESHASLYLDSPGTNNSRIIFTGGGSRNGSIEWDGVYDCMAFYHGAVTTPPDMVLTDPGWLGIGTESPTQPLHVAGNVHIEGNLTVGGTYPGGGGSGGIGGSGTTYYIPRWSGSDALENSSIVSDADGSIEMEVATSTGYVAKFINTADGIRSGVYGEGTGGIGVYGRTASDSPTYAGVSANSTGASPALRASAGTGLAGKFNGDVEVDGEYRTTRYNGNPIPVAFGRVSGGSLDYGTENISDVEYGAGTTIIRFTDLDFTHHRYVLSLTSSMNSTILHGDFDLADDYLMVQCYSLFSETYISGDFFFTVYDTEID